MTYSPKPGLSDVQLLMLYLHSGKPASITNFFCLGVPFWYHQVVFYLHFVPITNFLCLQLQIFSVQVPIFQFVPNNKFFLSWGTLMVSSSCNLSSIHTQLQIICLEVLFQYHQVLSVLNYYTITKIVLEVQYNQYLKS